MNPRQLLTEIVGDTGNSRPLNVTYHTEDSHPIVSGIVIDKALELDGRPANLSDDEWEKVWAKCNAHKDQQPQS